MTRSARFQHAVPGTLAICALALLVACSDPAAPDFGTGGKVSSGGATSGGAASGGAASGGATSSMGGSIPSNGGTSMGGALPAQGGAVSGGAANGGTANGGQTGRGGSASGGSPSGAGGAAASGGTGDGTGGIAAAGSAGAASGAGGGGTFDPCPPSDPCKVLPLGDSITWGISYGGGYRIKLFAKAAKDMKKMTFVGYDKGNPPSASVVSGLGAASSMWTPNHEGHSGWTIQQDDELVLGTSKQTNDGVNYTGKKVVADFMPHIVLVHLGTNDFRGDIAGAPDRLGKLIDHVVADAPNALVVVSSVIPFPSGGNAVGTFNGKIPGVVKARADAGKHVIYVDMFTALTSSDLSDGVHPNEGGYEKMAVVWYGAIKDYLH